MLLQYYWHGDLWHSWLFPAISFTDVLLQMIYMTPSEKECSFHGAHFTAKAKSYQRSFSSKILALKSMQNWNISVLTVQGQLLQFIATLFSLELLIWWIITNDKCPCWEKEIFPLGPLVSLRRDGEKCWLWPSVWIWPSLVCVTGHGVSCTPSDSYCAVANCWSVKIRCTTGPVTRSLKEDTK